MKKFFPRAEVRSFTLAVARARFVWLVVAALLLPLAASLSRNTERSGSDRFEAQEEAAR